MLALFEDEVTIANRSHETIVLGGEEGSHAESAMGRDLRLADLSDCVIVVCVWPAAIDAPLPLLSAPRTPTLTCPQIVHYSCHSHRRVEQLHHL
jgi:hypothetical protein